MKELFLFGVWNNFLIFCVIITVLSIIGLIISLVICGAESGKYGDKDGAKYSAKVAKFMAFILVISSIFCMLPSTKQLWEVRLDLIKLELSKKENVEAGVDQIKLLAKELECKYLNVCEKKEGK
jgi:hypothetical protein